VVSHQAFYILAILPAYALWAVMGLHLAYILAVILATAYYAGTYYQVRVQSV
jgi:hypothetical protein